MCLQRAACKVTNDTCRHIMRQLHTRRRGPGRIPAPDKHVTYNQTACEEKHEDVHAVVCVFAVLESADCQHILMSSCSFPGRPASYSYTHTHVRLQTQVHTEQLSCLCVDCYCGFTMPSVKADFSQGCDINVYWLETACLRAELTKINQPSFVSSL